MATPTRVFTVTELRRTGAGTTEATPVVFRWPSSSHAAPIEAIEAALQIKTVRTEDPGSDVVTEQVLSATWQPFDLEGEWNDQYGGRGFALNTYRDFARMVGRAPLVRIQIEQLSFVGLITNLKPRYKRESQIGYVFTVSPHTNETVGSERQIGPVTQAATKPITAHVGEAKEFVGALRTSSDVAATLPRATLRDVITAGLDKLLVLEQIIGRLEHAVAEGLGADAIRKLLALAAQFRALQQGAFDLASHYTGWRGADETGTTKPVDTLRTDEHARTTQATSRVLAGRALLAERDALSRASMKPLAVHRPYAGESLYRISARYYNTPDEWRRIYNANHLRTMLLDGTEELTIPERAV